MIGLDDFLIGVLTSGFVAWLADKDAKIDDAQRKRLEELLARVESLRTTPDKLRLLAAQSLRDECAKSPGLQKAADEIMRDPVLAQGLTRWLLEPDPEKYDAGKAHMASVLCDQFECDRSSADALLSSLEQGINADLQLGQLRGHEEHRLILKTLQGQEDWQARIERDNVYIAAMLERLLAANTLRGARPLRPQPRPWRRNNKLLTGSKPRVEDIEEGLDFRRTIHDKVMTAIRSTKPPALFAFLADQQMGKTTFLLRIGIDLALDGYPVLQPNSSQAGEPYADWVIQNADALGESLPLVLLIDDPRLDSENFTRQMTALYDQKARIIVLTAENGSDWNRANLDQNPLFDSAHKFGLGNAEGEALVLVEHLERTSAIQIVPERRDRLFDEVRQIEGGPGFFERVVSVASDDKYQSMSRIVRARLEQAGESADAAAFEGLYTLVCVCGSVGVSFPADVAQTVLGEEASDRAMAFNHAMPDPPVLLDEGVYAFSHERHAQQHLAEHRKGEAHVREDALRAIVVAGANHPEFTSFVGSLLEAHCARGFGDIAITIWDEVAEQFTSAHWDACEASALVDTWAKLLHFTNRASAALSVMQKVLEIDPRNSRAHNNYATILASIGDADAASGHYEHALEINPRNANAHYNYAVHLDSIGEIDEACGHYEQALEINPRSAEAHNNYAILLAWLGETEMARGHCEKALEINPRDAEVHLNYAIILRSLGETQKACEHREKAFDFDPSLRERSQNQDRPSTGPGTDADDE